VCLSFSFFFAWVITCPLRSQRSILVSLFIGVFVAWQMCCACTFLLRSLIYLAEPILFFRNVGPFFLFIGVFILWHVVVHVLVHFVQSFSKAS
jgi:hypothetical protein